jgi:hypothetical protein
MLVLGSSSGQRAWRDYFGVPVEEAADDVEWALRTLIAATTERTDR